MVITRTRVRNAELIPFDLKIMKALDAPFGADLPSVITSVGKSFEIDQISGRLEYLKGHGLVEVKPVRMLPDWEADRHFLTEEGKLEFRKMELISRIHDAKNARDIGRALISGAYDILSEVFR